MSWIYDIDETDDIYDVGEIYNINEISEINAMSELTALPSITDEPNPLVHDRIKPIGVGLCCCTCMQYWGYASAGWCQGHKVYTLGLHPGCGDWELRSVLSDEENTLKLQQRIGNWFRSLPLVKYLTNTD